MATQSRYRLPDGDNHYSGWFYRTGQSAAYGKISKQGDRMLRWLLVLSALSATPISDIYLTWCREGEDLL